MSKDIPCNKCVIRITWWFSIKKMVSVQKKMFSYIILYYYITYDTLYDYTTTKHMIMLIKHKNNFELQLITHFFLINKNYIKTNLKKIIYYCNWNIGKCQTQYYTKKLKIQVILFTLQISDPGPWCETHCITTRKLTSNLYSEPLNTQDCCNVHNVV